MPTPSMTNVEECYRCGHTKGEDRGNGRFCSAWGKSWTRHYYPKPSENLTPLKRCNKCGLLKNKINFYHHDTSSDGLRTTCKECDRECNRTPEQMEKDKNNRADYYQRNKLRINRRINNYRITNQEKTRAKRIVSESLKKGDIKKKPCAFCDSKNTDAHHFDYDSPLKVIWLCRAHHQFVHSSIRGLSKVEYEKGLNEALHQRQSTLEEVVKLVSSLPLVDDRGCDFEINRDDLISAIKKLKGK